MPDAILGDEPMVAEWDADAGLYVVRAWVAGPAGTAGLRLAGDIEVDIDVAWPTRLAELRIPSTDGELDERVRPVVERLLGPGRLWRLLSGRRDEPWRLGGDRLYPNGDGGVSRGMRRAALARQIGHDRRHSTLRRAVALLEAASWAERSGRGLGLRRLRTVDARLGAELLLSELDRAELVLDDDAARELSSVLRRVAFAFRDDAGTQLRLEALATDLQSRRHPSASSREVYAAAAMPAMAPAAGGRRLRAVHARGPAPPPVRVDRRTLPMALEHAAIDAHRVSVSEIEVRVHDEPDRAPGLWARVFDDAGTLRGMSPLRASGRDGAVLLLVSPEAFDGAVVDVVDQPGIRRPSRAVAAVEAALDAGRDAAGHERAGRRQDAIATWGRCAAEWDDAGDLTRAATARSYAMGERAAPSRGGDRIPRPLIADRVT